MSTYTLNANVSTLSLNNVGSPAAAATSSGTRGGPPPTRGGGPPPGRTGPGPLSYAQALARTPSPPVELTAEQQQQERRWEQHRQQFAVDTGNLDNATEENMDLTPAPSSASRYTQGCLRREQQQQQQPQVQSDTSSDYDEEVEQGAGAVGGVSRGDSQPYWDYEFSGDLVADGRRSGLSADETDFLAACQRDVTTAPTPMRPPPPILSNAELAALHDDVNANWTMVDVRRANAKKAVTTYLNRIDKLLQATKGKEFLGASDCVRLHGMVERASAEFERWETLRNYLQTIAPEVADFQADGRKFQRWQQRENDDYAERDERYIELNDLVCRRTTAAYEHHSRLNEVRLQVNQATLQAQETPQPVALNTPLPVAREVHFDTPTPTPRPQRSRRSSELILPHLDRGVGRAIPVYVAGGQENPSRPRAPPRGADLLPNQPTAEWKNRWFNYFASTLGDQAAVPAGGGGGGPPGGGVPPRNYVPPPWGPPPPFPPPGGRHPGGGGGGGGGGGNDPPGGGGGNDPPGGGGGNGPPNNNSDMRDLANLIRNARAEPKTEAMKLMDFDGTYEDWSTFYDTFYALVHKRSYEDIQKFNMLRTHLKGDALRECKGAPLTGANYLNILRKLRFKFGNQRLLMDVMLEKLLKKPKYTSMSQFGDAVAYARGEVDTMMTQGLTLEHPEANTFLLKCLTRIMPDEIMAKWNLSVTAREKEINLSLPDTPWNLSMIPLRNDLMVEDFLQFCELRVSARQADDIKAKTDGKKSGGGGRWGKAKAGAATALVTAADPINVNVATGETQKKQKKGKSEPSNGLAATVAGEVPAPTWDVSKFHLAGCVWCGANHAPTGCTKYKGFPPRERWARIRYRHTKNNENLCFQCLGPHRVNDCTGAPCGLNGCPERHHRFICRADGN